MVVSVPSFKAILKGAAASSSSIRLYGRSLSMSPLDSPVARLRSLPTTDERLHGEKLSANSAEDSSSLRRGILYGGLASLFLWTVIILVMSRIF